MTGSWLVRRRRAAERIRMVCKNSIGVCSKRLENREAKEERLMPASVAKDETL